MVVEQFIQLHLNNPLVIALEVAALRSVAGWLENTVRKKESFSFKRFGSTYLRMLIQTLGWVAATGQPTAAFAALLSDWLGMKWYNGK